LCSPALVGVKATSNLFFVPPPGFDATVGLNVRPLGARTITFT
jgi:hypothetical protein